MKNPGKNGKLGKIISSRSNLAFEVVGAIGISMDRNATGSRRCELPWALMLAGGMLAASAGCTPTYHRKDADREVYRILARKRARALGVLAGFSIDPPKEAPLARLRRERAVPETGPEPVLSAADLDKDGFAARIKDGLPIRKGVMRLTLRDALVLAARHSRDYQSAKEDLYLSALALTLDRHRWKPTFLARVTGYAEDTDTDNWKGATGEFGVTQLLALGGEMTINVTTDLMKYTTHDPRDTASSVLTAELVQPLLKGGGRLLARENLTQAERDTVYQVRSFARYQRTFCVDITTQHYRVLQQRDSVMNQWRNYERILESVRQTELRAQAPGAGPTAMLQVGQAHQDALRARGTWVRALWAYQDQLDNLKLALSLPVDAQVELEPAEIEKLREAGPGKVSLTLPRATELALERRLDLRTAKDQVEDEGRQALLARNGLAPAVDLRMTASIDTPSRTTTTDILGPDGTVIETKTTIDQRRLARFRLDTGHYKAALEGELPLDRKSERNAYRSALIDLERARRAFEELREQVKLSVRRAWRNLQEAAESYRIQRESVALARRRVESTGLLLQRGDATARDVLEANEALVNAENALTRTLIDHAIARLALWRDSEVLRVGPDGVWQEENDDD